MKAIVTGGAGFIGSHLVDALIDAGHEVTSIDWQEPGDRKNERAHYVLFDIREPELLRVVKEMAPDVVFHLAAHINDREKDPLVSASHNVMGSVNVFEAARLAGAKKIIFASSGAAYGLQEKFPVTEKMIPRPRTPYGISKLAAEKYLDAYHTVHGLVTVALRFANVYGPRQDGSKGSGAVAIFTDALLRGEPPFINGDGSTTRDYVYVGDVVEALMLASMQEISGVFNVCTKRETSTKELYDLVKESLGSDLQALFRTEVEDAVKRSSMKWSEIKRAFGWKPKVSLKRGVRMTVKWYKKWKR